MTTTAGTATPHRDLTTPETITVLKHLANGRTLEFVAAATGLTRDHVLAVGDENGYPDRDRLSWAVDELQRLDDEAAVATLPAATPADRLKAATAERSRGVTPLPRPRPAPAATPAASATSVSASTLTPAAAADKVLGAFQDRDLLDAAARSGKARTRKLGERITDLLEQLRRAVNDEQAAAAAAQQAAKEKAERDAEIAKLKARLAELEGKPAPKTSAAANTSTSSTSGSASPGDAKAVRVWAAANGIDCPAMGRVPATVRSQYDAAHSAEAMRDSA